MLGLTPYLTACLAHRVPVVLNVCPIRKRFYFICYREKRHKENPLPVLCGNSRANIPFSITGNWIKVASHFNIFASFTALHGPRYFFFSRLRFVNGADLFWNVSRLSFRPTRAKVHSGWVSANAILASHSEFIRPRNGFYIVEIHIFSLVKNYIRTGSTLLTA